MGNDKPKAVSRSLAYYREHREEILKKRKEYYRKNRELCIARSKRYAERVLRPKLERQKQGLEPATTLEAMRKYQRDYYNAVWPDGIDYNKKGTEEWTIKRLPSNDSENYRRTTRLDDARIYMISTRCRFKLPKDGSGTLLFQTA